MKHSKCLDARRAIQSVGSVALVTTWVWAWASLSLTNCVAAGPGVVINPALSPPLLRVEITNTSAGSTLSLPIYFQSDANVTALQFDVTFETNRLTGGSLTAPNTHPDHIVRSFFPREGVQRVLVYSLRNTVLLSGHLVSLPLTVAAQAAPGTISISFTNAIAVASDGLQAQPVEAAPGAIIIQSIIREPRLEVGARLPGGSFVLKLTGQPGRDYSLQFSTDLLQWVSTLTNRMTEGGIRYLGGFEPRINIGFYRAVEVP